MLDEQAARNRLISFLRERHDRKGFSPDTRRALATSEAILVDRKKGRFGRGLKAGWGRREGDWWLALEGSPSDPDFCMTLLTLRAMHHWQIPIVYRADFTVEIPGHPLTWLFDLPDVREHEFIWSVSGDEVRQSTRTPRRKRAASYEGYDPNFRTGLPADRMRVELEWRPSDAAPADVVLARRLPWQRAPLVMLAIPDHGLSEDEIARLERAQRIGLGRHLERLDDRSRASLTDLLDRLRRDGTKFDFGQTWDRAWPWHRTLLWHLLVDDADARFAWT